MLSNAKPLCQNVLIFFAISTFGLLGCDEGTSHFTPARDSLSFGISNDKKSIHFDSRPTPKSADRVKRLEWSRCGPEYSQACPNNGTDGYVQVQPFVTSLQLEYFKKHTNSIECCVVIRSIGFKACHHETDETCDYGTKQTK